MAKFKKYILISLLIFLIPAAVIRAEAAKCDPSLENCAGGGKIFLDTVTGNVYETKNVGEYSFIDWIGALTLLFISLLGTFFVLKLIYSGFLWMTANGNEDQVSKAKGILGNSVVGLLIVLSALTISWYALDKIGSGTIKNETASQSEE